MALSFEAVKREISGELIDILKLRSAAFLSRLEGCRTMVELRQAVFVILDEVGKAEPEKSKKLLLAWQSLGEQ